MMILKKCPKCKLTKNRLDEFYFSNGKKKRCSSFCKKCSNQEVYKWKKKHREKIRQWTRKNVRKTKFKLFQLLGNRCIKCGYSDRRALQIDHINGGGNKHRKRQGSGFYPDVLKHLKNYQILCANCNWIKRYENKEGSRMIINK